MKVDRLISIIMLLLDKERIGAQELADMFEVSPRTIYRDIDAINLAGIPICSTSGVGGGFEIMPKYKIDKKMFSNDDLSAILTGLSGLSNMINNKELVHALAKVKSLIPSDQKKEIALKTNQLYIDLNPWMGNKNIPTCLECIKSALQDSKLISFDYAGRNGNITIRTAEPYQLVLKNSHWYFYGFCKKRMDFRLFKLSRIANLIIKDETFTPRDFPQPQLDFSDIVTTLQTEIKLRIHKSIMDRILDYCSYEHFMPDGSEHYLVRFPFIENEYYYHVLFSFGDQCECIEPQTIRTEMKRRAQKFVLLYEM